MASLEQETEKSLAESRPRRAIAGRNIGKLIDQEQDADDFYQSAYGGFEEESADEEYEEEDSEEDEVDSDFDVDESTWHMEEGQGEEQLEEKKKKKQWIKPTKPKQQTTEQPHIPTSTDSQSIAKPPKPKKAKTVTIVDTSEPTEQRSLRKSTLVVSEEFRRRMQEEEEMKRLQRKRRANTVKKPERRLTQKELLEEAMVTEVENLASLEAYSRMEAEKKKVKQKENVIQGPFVRFHSISMPLVEELPDPVAANKEGESRETNVNTAGSTDKTAIENQSTNSSSLPAQSVAGPTSEPQKYCRNFLIFADAVNYPSAFFPSQKPRKPRKRFCPITGLPAKYMDPLTGTPYTTSHAFRVIRNRYISEGEQKCEKRLLQLSSWLEEKKRKKLESKTY